MRSWFVVFVVDWFECRASSVPRTRTISMMPGLKYKPRTRTYHQLLVGYTCKSCGLQQFREYHNTRRRTATTTRLGSPKCKCTLASDEIPMTQVTRYVSRIKLEYLVKRSDINEQERVPPYHKPRSTDIW